MNPCRHGLFLLLAVVAASPRLSGADPLQNVAKKFSKAAGNLPVKRLAVLPFPYHNGDVSSGSSIVSERLTTWLVETGGAEVVERALLDKAAAEMRLGMTGLIESSTTQKIGKVLGAGALVTGTLIDLDDGQTEVNARLIQTETGSVLAAATTRIQRSWMDLPRPAFKAAPADEYEGHSGLHMSKLIPTSAPAGQAMAGSYSGPTRPSAAQQARLPAHEDRIPDEPVLTLRQDDLIPVNHRGQTDPERILNDFLAEHEPGTGDDIRIARRIYHRNADPNVRGRALLAMGHLLERSGRPGQAAEAYSQILREFPDSPALQQQATEHLQNLSPR